MRFVRAFENINKLEGRAKEYARVETLATVSVGEKSLPIKSFIFGPDDPTLPTFGLFGGVHGIEKVGSHLVIQYLTYILENLKWDKQLQELFSQMRLVAIPIVNPGGVYLQKRATPDGIDIMRNAPGRPVEKKKFLYSGQRLSAKLPWYQGVEDEMALETKTLIDFVKREIFPSVAPMTLDIHSGFGMRDRLWYPYGRTLEKPKDFSAILRFKGLLKNSLPYHIYKVEQQCSSYLIEGDVWDYLYDEFKNNDISNRVYVPWTLEMGSWLWVKKNPLQMIKFKGFFNPIKSYRFFRVMRRHERLLNFYLKSTLYNKHWAYKKSSF